MKRNVFLLFVLLCILPALASEAKESRNIFNNAYRAVGNKAEVFRPGGAWVPYPAYSDRQAWDSLTEGYRDSLSRLGEKWLDFRWIYTPATVYLEYEKTKDRGLCAIYDHPNREALADLVLAELGEGKGRFIPQIINGVYFASERISWNHMQHQTAQPSRRTLPEPDERVVSLNSTVWAADVAIAWHFFHEEFDKYDPSISRTVLKALEINQFVPYLEGDYGWMGFSGKGRVSNWNCFCNYFSLLASMFAEQDPSRLLETVDKCTRSFDRYMDFTGSDGATEEGSFYWTMATAKVYEFARLLCDASGGAVDLLGDFQIRNMSRYMVDCCIGDNWVLDISDADGRLGPDVMYRDVFYRFGKDTGCRTLSDLALSMMADPASKTFRPCQMGSLESAREMYRSLESLRYSGALRSDCEAALRDAGGDWEAMVRNLTSGFTPHWYPETQLAVLRRPAGWYVGAKGGHNAETHGHLDVGSAVVFYDGLPVFVDPGVETYAKTTFGKLRESQWWYGSEWHNVPLINGYVQAPGAEASASSCQFDSLALSFGCDVAGAYPEEACVKSWTRSYRIDGEKVLITDRCRLAKRIAPDVINFVTDAPVVLPGGTFDGYTVRKGEVLVLSRSFDGKKVLPIRVKYPLCLTPSVEKKEMSDPRFQAVWGEDLYRLCFTTRADAPLQAKYEFSLSR